MSDHPNSIRQRLEADIKAAMKARDKARLGTLRLMLAALKQKEIDERTPLDEAGTLAVLDKMIKQRRDAREQYQAARRQDLAGQEAAELAVIEAYLPAALSEDEIRQGVDEAVDETGAGSTRDMGKVMAVLKSRLQGRADMARVSRLVKEKLSGLSG